MNEHTVEIRSELEKLEQRMRSAISEGDNYAALRDVAHTLGRILRPEEMNQPQAGASERITVVVADDHAALRESIAARLAAEMDIDVVATVGDYQATMEALENQAPDIILLDLSMPGGSGVDFIRRVLTAGYETRFVVLTMHRGRSMLQASMDAGAHGFLTKTVSPSEIVGAIREVAGGSSSVSVSLVKESHSEVSQMYSLLSERERSVLYLLSRGYTTKEIAVELGLQPATVDTYRQRVVKKLGIRNRPELVRFALDAGVLS